MGCKDNTLKMPQLVKALFMLSVKSNRIPKVTSAHMRWGGGAGLTALRPGLDSQFIAGRQREDKMFQTQASISREPGAALSLSSRAGEGGWIRGMRREMDKGMSHKMHVQMVRI